MIYRHEMRQNVKTLVLWSALLGGIIFLFMLLFPTMKDQMQAMADSYANMGGFSAAFGMDKISFADAVGFYGIEAGAMLSIGGSMFAALGGIAMLSKEEGSHTAEFLMTHPLPRWKVIAQKLLALVTQIVAINAVCLAAASLAFAAIGEPLVWRDFLLFHLAQFLLHLEIGLLCFGISAFLKKNNVGIGIGVAVLLYFVNIFVNTSEDVDFLRWVTPYRYADAADILSSGSLDGPLIAIGMGVAVVAIAAAFVKYLRKDLAV